MRPIYLAGYDTEQPLCVEAVRALVGIHRRMRIPATFFLVGILVEHNQKELRDLLSDDLFEIASHTYTHCHLESVSPDTVRDQLRRTQGLLQEVFGCSPLGFRTPGGLVRGYREDPERLAVFVEMGFEYVSSQGWGVGRTMPAPIVPSYSYAIQGFPQLVEIPFHGWHENLLIQVHPWQSPSQPLKPGVPQTVEEWTAPFRVDINTTFSQSLSYYSPAMHPWSLHRFDPDCRQVESLLKAAQRRGMEFMKFCDFARRWQLSRV